MKYQHAIVLALAATASLAFSQAPQHEHHPAKPSVTKPAMGMNMDKCMRDMEAGQKRLDSLAAKMNASEGAQRIDASAALLNELVKQHRDMVQMCHEMMMSGHGTHMRPSRKPLISEKRRNWK